MFELLPCPFCGAQPEMNKQPHDSLGRIFHWVVCSCGACGSDTQSKADAVALWNTRTPSDAAVRAAAEEIADYLANNTVKIYGSVDKFEAIITRNLAARTGELVK